MWMVWSPKGATVLLWRKRSDSLGAEDKQSDDLLGHTGRDSPCFLECISERWHYLSGGKRASEHFFPLTPLTIAAGIAAEGGQLGHLSSAILYSKYHTLVLWCNHPSGKNLHQSSMAKPSPRGPAWVSSTPCPKSLEF